MAKSSRISMKFDEFKLLTRKSCFFFSTAREKTLVVCALRGSDKTIFSDNFVCSPYAIVDGERRKKTDKVV
jgi:hypothetical protein